MADVGTGIGHQNQMDELDAEIAAMESAVKGENQQPHPEPEQVVTDQPPEGDQQLQAGEDGMVEAVTSVEEFLATGEEAAQPGQEQAEVETTPEPEVAPQPQEQVTQTTSGRRSWKTDFLELENRYVKLRQASDQYKFESKQQIAGLQQQLVQSQERMDAMQQKLIEFQNAAGKQNMANVFSQEDIDVLGESTVTNVQNAITQAVEAATQPLQTELLQMKKAERDRLRQQADLNKSQAYQTFEHRLETLVPDFRTINTDPEFIKWLKQPSPYSGGPRIGFLHQAEATGDVERVAQFFVEWKQMMAAPQQMLEQSVVPSGQGGGGAAPVTTPQPQQSGKRLYTRKFVNEFYDDDIAGRYKGREALRDQLDAEIDLALAEGRVV